MLDDMEKFLRTAMGNSLNCLKAALAALTRLLRAGRTGNGGPSRRKFVVRSRPLGLPRGLSHDDIENLLEVLEGPEHK